MSTSLTTAQIASFDTEVKHAYQGSGKLRDTVRVKSGVVGATHRFPKMAAGTATPRVPQTDVVPMNLQHSNRTATLEDWNAPEYTDVFDNMAVNFDERTELAEIIAKAIGRREDQLILDALDAASSTLTIASSVGGSSSDLNVTKLRRGSRLLGEQGVMDEELTWVGSFANREGLLGETETTSTDFNSVQALTSGQLNSFMGFGFKWIENRAGEGGLPLSTNDRTNYAYAKSSMGLAIGLDKRMEVNYIPTKTSWLANMLFKAGSVDIDALGIVEAVCVQST
jgi:hypothetical protein